MKSTLYVGGRMFDGAEAHDGQGILVTDGKIERIAPWPAPIEWSTV